jgi:hypothetical protein
MGFDTHMILETVPALPSTRQNAHQVINPTSRHYAGTLPTRAGARRAIVEYIGWYNTQRRSLGFAGVLRDVA